MYLLPFIFLSAITPAEAVAAAVADLEQVPATRHSQTRYVMMPEPTIEARQAGGRVLGFVLNSISRSRTIRLPEPVDPQWLLMRIDLAAYADLRQLKTYHELFAAWENLVQSDPYFHLRTQVTTGTKVETVSTDGGWVGLEHAKKLRDMTQSTGAVLRADYVITRIVGVDYYAWSGVPLKEADFFQLFGVDTAVIGRLSADSAANLLRSHVTNKPRRIIERPGVFGSVFQTKDVDGENPDRDPFRTPVDFGGQQFNFQASEFFALGRESVMASGAVRRGRESHRFRTGQGRQGLCGRRNYSSAAHLPALS